MMKPSPYVTPESETFWEGCKSGKLLYQVCKQCGHKQFYPRVHCVLCGGEELAWAESSGMGTIRTFTVVYRAPSASFKVPYALALVEVEEGFTMMSNILGAGPEELTIGKRVVVDFEQGVDGMVIPQFRLYLSFEQLVPGKMYGESRLLCDHEKVEQWNAIYPELAGQRTTKHMPPGMSAVIVMDTYDTALKGRPKGNVHGSQTFEMYAPVPIGETVATRLYVEDKFIKKDKKWVVVRTESTTSQGVLAFEGKMQILWAE